MRRTAAPKPDRTHFHVCLACFRIFSHKAPPEPQSLDAIQAQHLCPHCGAGPYSLAYSRRRAAKWRNLAQQSIGLGFRIGDNEHPELAIARIRQEMDALP